MYDAYHLFSYFKKNNNNKIITYHFLFCLTQLRNVWHEGKIEHLKVWLILNFIERLETGIKHVWKWEPKWNKIQSIRDRNVKES